MSAPPRECDLSRGLTNALSLQESAPAMVDSTDIQTSVYRYYDKQGLLLYVGITERGIKRNREHNATKEWWQHVAYQEVDHFTTRSDAEARERALITQHRPPFNIQHNPDWRDTKAVYLAFAGSGDGALPNALPWEGGIMPLEYDKEASSPGNNQFAFTSSSGYAPVASKIVMPYPEWVWGKGTAKVAVASHVNTSRLAARVHVVALPGKMPRKTFMTQLRLSLTAPDANGKSAVKRAQLIYSARS